MQEHCGSRLAHRISKWMLLSFVDSASQRELLRTSSLIRKPTLSEQEGGGSHDDAEESWVVPVLRFWNRDGLPIIDEQNTGGGGGSSSPISRERNRASVWSSSPVMRPAASTKLVEPILTTMDRSSEDNKGRSLIPPEEDDDDAADGRSASPNSAIWSQEVELKPEPPVTELGKRAASPSALFEFTAGGPKRIKV
ncbi:hypothetical protein PG993_006344 [Apiospora rasikravindrae]|uniref:Uncharacterized protein n=1 Tax=Apiospora rasikravindrae TaxID=990691 RepID=A0ABR1T5F1_9PEZI